MPLLLLALIVALPIWPLQVIGLAICGGAFLLVTNFLLKKKHSARGRDRFLRIRRNGQVYYTSYAWDRLRRKVLKHYGCACMRCGAKDGPVHVDHIKPRSKYPHLEFEFDNLQVLCGPCNMKKSNINETDYRKKKLSSTHPPRWVKTRTRFRKFSRRR
jgi:5-methylcytosine-specific restriction endonuclease McrA